MGVLTELLRKVPIDTGTWLTSIRDLAAVVQRDFTIRFIEGVTAEVPALEFDDERHLERVIAKTLTCSTGGRATDVTSWEHLPGVLGSWAARAVGHPKTLHEMEDGLRRAIGSHVLQPTRFEHVSSIDIPEDTLVFVRTFDFGTLFLRSAGTPVLGRAIAYDPQTFEMTVEREGGVYVFPVNPDRIPGRHRPPLQLGDNVFLEDVALPMPQEMRRPAMVRLRAGIVFQPSAIEVVRRHVEPVRRSVYDWLRMPWAERFPAT